MFLPFSFTYTLINNVLTIVFDFSGLSRQDFQTLKRDWFSQGLVINETGFDMNFSQRTQTYVINTDRFGWDGESEITMRLMGWKPRKHWRRGGGDSSEYPVQISTEQNYREIIRYHLDVIHTEQKELDYLFSQAGRIVGKGAAKAMSRKEKGCKMAIRGHNNAIALWKRKIEELTTTGVTKYKQPKS